MKSNFTVPTNNNLKNEKSTIHDKGGPIFLHIYILIFHLV